jgi:branched-subunit amino acid aminotransferase/4-amino-4-deoxychorismate lyase
MKAILNGKIIEEGELKLATENRGFKYGDGLFESIALRRGGPRLLELHLNRLTEGAEYLEIETSNGLRQEIIEDGIRQLQQSNNIAGDSIIKIYLWRNAMGKYGPSGNSADVLLTIETTTFKDMHNVPIAGFSEQVINYPTGFSRFKTMSALKYVLAGIEKENQQLDEIIILDHEGHISEALSSNVFWKKEAVYYTPPLSTGCISGVMRQWLIKALKKDGHHIQEKLAKKGELLKSDSLFTTNAAGIGHIQAIGQFSFESDQNVQKLLEQIS